MKALQIIIISVLLPAMGLAQKENNIWAFGYHLGLDFNRGGPSFTATSINALEGCAAVSDRAGNLLFYSDGVRVFDRTHSIMPNGSGLLGSPTSTQGVAIASVPGEDSLYYLFIVDAYFSSIGKTSFSYSLVDLRLNGGLGDIDPADKNIIADSMISEKMVIAGNCEQWILLHHQDSALFYAYRTSSSGRLGSPVLSRTGTPKRGPLGFGLSEMKVSTAFDKVAMAATSMYSTCTIELFDFNKITGIVSNPELLDSFKENGAYGVEFSAGGSKLYISRVEADTPALYQYDISLATPAARRGSRYRVDAATHRYGLRRGPDSMIYTIEFTPTNFSRIRAPELPGPSCDFEKDFMPGSFSNTANCTSFGNSFIPIDYDTAYTLLKDTTVCTGKSITWTVPAGRDSYKWSDGSTITSRIITPPATLLLYSRTGCRIFIDTFRADTVSGIHRHHSVDTTACIGSRLVLNGRTGSESYLWDDGSTGSVRTVSTIPGKYWVRSIADCIYTTDTFRVTEKPFDVSNKETDTSVCFESPAIIKGPEGYSSYRWNAGNNGKDTTLAGTADLVLIATDSSSCRILRQGYHVVFVDGNSGIPDTFTCTGDKILLDATMDGAAYRWNTGDTTAAIKAGKGTYWVFVTRYGCTYTDTITVAHKDVHLSIGDDQYICKDQPLTLKADIDDAQSYLWSTGATGKSIIINQSGRYSLTIQKDGCTVSDEVDINYVNCEKCIAFTNAFTPNRDGINDFFKPLLNCPARDYELRVYNRWGQEVFHTTNPANTWDGSYQGLPADANTYFYMLKISFEGQDTKTQLFKGEITLIK